MTGGSPRRLVIEALVLSAAIAGLISFSSRGPTGAAASSTTGGLDLFVAGVPILLAIAGGLVLLRLFGIAAAVVGWLAGRGRGLGSVYALRGLARARAGWTCRSSSW